MIMKESPQELNFSSTRALAKENEVKLWYQKLGHLHLKGMKRIISIEAVRGIPKLKNRKSENMW